MDTMTIPIPDIDNMLIIIATFGTLLQEIRHKINNKTHLPKRKQNDGIPSPTER